MRRGDTPARAEAWVERISCTHHFIILAHREDGGGAQLLAVPAAALVVQAAAAAVSARRDRGRCGRWQSTPHERADADQHGKLSPRGKPRVRLKSTPSKRPSTCWTQNTRDQREPPPLGGLGTALALVRVIHGHQRPRSGVWRTRRARAHRHAARRAARRRSNDVVPLDSRRARA